MQFQNAENSLGKFFETISEVSWSISAAKGAMKGFRLTQGENTREAMQIEWILKSHIGTLEKLEGCLPKDRSPSTFELLAASRNLFENVVWLKLFEKDQIWGEAFYAKFLEESIADVKGLIAKIEQEIELFQEAEIEDREITRQMCEAFQEKGVDKDGSAAVFQKYETMRSELDERVHREFSIFSEAAKVNGYGFQTSLLKTKELPRCRDELSKLEMKKTSLENLIGADQLKKQLSRTNWRQSAQTVGMVRQYDYLYRLSSRLLHSGPMNILTEKDLTESEKNVLLGYVTVAEKDILELVKNFQFTGKIEMLYFEVE